MSSSSALRPRTGRATLVIGAVLALVAAIVFGANKASAATDLPPPGQIQVVAKCGSVTVLTNIASADVTAKVTADGTVYNYPEVPGTLFPLGPGSLILSSEIPALQTAVSYSGTITFTPTNGDPSVSQSFGFNCNPVPPADADGDGVPDSSDKCPGTAAGASVDANGCAASQRDSDGDGVSDNLDKCANTPAGTKVGADGCPVVIPPADADNDGVPDSSDKCANTPAGADVDANGCAASQRDSDGDGVSDAADKCPGTAAGAKVGKDGCPKQDPPGNNGTLKIHEQGTPSGTENNDPKVCVFNVEGFGFDAGQTGYLMFNVQGGDGPTGEDAGPFVFGPTNSSGYFATEYFNLKPGHYKATLYGKDSAGKIDLKDVKAKSKVFKVQCAAESKPEGVLVVSSDKCEQISFSAKDVKPEGATATFKLDGAAKPAGTYTVTPGSHTVELYVDGKLVDSKTITVKECPVTPPADKEFTVTYGMQECVPGANNDTVGSPVVSPEGAATVSEGSWSGGKRTVTVTPNEGYKPASGTVLSKDYTDDGSNCGVVPPVEAENNFHSGAMSCDNTLSSLPTGSIVNSAINADDDTNKPLNLTVDVKREDGTIVDTDTATVPDGESYYNVVDKLEAGQYKVVFRSGDKVLKEIDVHVEICEFPTLPDIKDVTDGCVQGIPVVTNPNKVQVTVATGINDNEHGEFYGTFQVEPGATVPFPTGHDKFDYVAYVTETGQDASYGSVDVSTCKVVTPPVTPPHNPHNPPPVTPPHNPPHHVTPKPGHSGEVVQTAQNISGGWAAGFAAGGLLLLLTEKRRRRTVKI